MPAIVMSRESDCVVAVRGEWQSDRNIENPQERSHAAAMEETHKTSAARVLTNMSLIFNELIP
jgi:hypothetical protein